MFEKNRGQLCVLYLHRLRAAVEATDTSEIVSISVAASCRRGNRDLSLTPRYERENMHRSYARGTGKMDGTVSNPCCSLQPVVKGIHIFVVLLCLSIILIYHIQSRLYSPLFTNTYAPTVLPRRPDFSPVIFQSGCHRQSSPQACTPSTWGVPAAGSGTRTRPRRAGSSCR